VSFDIPEYTAQTTGLGTLRILEAIRASGVQTRFYQASSSEMFGAAAPPQNETTPFHPRSPYGASKVFAYWITVNFREAYGLFAVNGVLFNHESPRRGETFVSRKITRAVARIRAGRQDKLYLGNLDALRGKLGQLGLGLGIKLIAAPLLAECARQPSDALRLSAALFGFWHFHGPRVEGDPLSIG